MIPDFILFLKLWDVDFYLIFGNMGCHDKFIGLLIRFNSFLQPCLC